MRLLHDIRKTLSDDMTGAYIQISFSVVGYVNRVKTETTTSNTLIPKHLSCP